MGGIVKNSIKQLEILACQAKKRKSFHYDHKKGHVKEA